MTGTQETDVPFVSLIVVAHGEVAHVGKCLESLRVQDYPQARREFILVHSDCSDGTREALAAWRRGPGADESVTILANPKRTLATGWNVALGAAKGDVIIRLDAHAQAGPMFLRRSIEIMRERKESVVGGRRPALRPTGSMAFLLWMADRSLFGSSQAAYRRWRRPGYVDTLAHAAYERRVFQIVGGYDERLDRSEDREIHYRMKQAGFRMYYDPSIVSYQLARSTIPSMLHQKWLTGYWISLALPISPRCFSLRNFVPGFFAVALLVTGILATAGHPLSLLALLGTYGMCAVIASLVEVSRATEGWGLLLAPLLPMVFVAMHLSYGFGLLCGVTRLLWRMPPHRAHVQRGATMSSGPRSPVDEGI